MTTKTATFRDDSSTGLRWEMTDWTGIRPSRNDLGTSGVTDAAALVHRLRKRGVAVTIIGDAPGASDLRRIAG